MQILSTPAMTNAFVELEIIGADAEHTRPLTKHWHNGEHVLPKLQKPCSIAFTSHKTEEGASIPVSKQHCGA